jgi:hypothetical protein
MANESIRKAAALYDVKLWKLAERWGCNDGNFSRKLRHQFSPADEQRALEIIRGIAAERAQENRPTEL